MNQTVLLWILGGYSVAMLTLGGALWRHVNECRDTRVDIATIKAAVDSIVREIGDHESGIRHRLHQMQNALIRLENGRRDER